MMTKNLIWACALSSITAIAAPAKAMFFESEIPAGYSNQVFQFSGTDSFMDININALGVRDPTLCPSCYSSYTDNFTVEMFGQNGSLLDVVSGTNYFYTSAYSSSHGIGAGPIDFSVPIGVTTFEILNQLFITGFNGSNGLPLTSGNLYVSTDAPFTAVTPIPAALPLFAGGLGVMGWLGWRRKRSGPAK